MSFCEFCGNHDAPEWARYWPIPFRACSAKCKEMIDEFDEEEERHAGKEEEA